MCVVGLCPAQIKNLYVNWCKSKQKYVPYMSIVISSDWLLLCNAHHSRLHASILPNLLSMPNMHIILLQKFEEKWKWLVDHASYISGNFPVLQ